MQRYRNLISSDSKGFSLIELLVGTAIAGVLILGMSSLLTNAMDFYVKRKFTQDLYDLRSDLALADCSETIKLLENDGKICKTADVVTLVLADAAGRKVPKNWDKYGLGKVGSLSLKVECSNDQVRYYYAKVSPDTGIPVADPKLNLKPEWTDLFDPKHLGLSPFNRYYTNCN